MPHEQFEPAVDAAENGDGDTQHQLFALLYEELHRLARDALRRHGSSLALGATTLLHEAYLNLHKRRGVTFPNRAHFLAYASCAMRGLIVDYARRGQTLKRGAAFEITSLRTNTPEQAAGCEELQQLNSAIELLAVTEPRLAQVIDLKYFGGFSFNEIAAMWGLTERTVQRDWEKARLFLHRLLSDFAAPQP